MSLFVRLCYNIEKYNADKDGSICMKKTFGKKLTAGLLLLAAIAAVILAFWAGSSNSLSTEAKTTKIGFEDIGELATQEAYCTEVNVMEGSREIFGITIPFTQSKYIYSYDIIVKAGLDFSRIKWDSDDESKTITVTMPPVKVLGVPSIYTDTFKVYHEEESVFKKISLSDINISIGDMQQTATDDAVNNGLLEKAKDNAEKLLKALFVSRYDEYNVKFIYPDGEYEL